MPDQSIEQTPDVGNLHEVAKITNKFINGVPSGARDAFATLSHDASLEMAETIAKSETDAVTGLLLDTVMRRNVAERLKTGQSGVLLVVDLVGLKHLNTYGHEVGNNGLKIMANTLNKLGPTELGRKGDEFYMFIENVSETEFTESFGEFIRAQRKLGNLKEPTTKTELLNYWDCGYIDNVQDLNPMIDRLDKGVEDIKRKLRDKILEKIDLQPEEDRVELMMLYFNLKVRAEGREISEFVNSLDHDIRRQYGIADPQPRNRLDDRVIEDIPQSRKDLFQRFQEESLMELNLG